MLSKTKKIETIFLTKPLNEANTQKRYSEGSLIKQHNVLRIL